MELRVCDFQLGRGFYSPEFIGQRLKIFVIVTTGGGGVATGTYRVGVGDADRHLPMPRTALAPVLPPPTLPPQETNDYLGQNANDAEAERS